MKPTICCLWGSLSTIACSAVLAAPANPALADFAWVGRTCSAPAVALPPKVALADPDAPGKTLALRSLVDTDGDGVCEIYDVMPLEQSPITGKIYGHPIRISRYRAGHWHTGPSWLAGWIPIVLEDRKSKARIILKLNFGGNAGESTRVAFVGAETPCEKERLLIVAAALLLSSPPPELRSDPALSEDWTGPVRYVVEDRILQGRFDNPYDGSLAACMAPLRDVISQLKAQLMSPAGS